MVKECLECINNGACELAIDAKDCTEYDDGDTCEMWVLRRPDQLPQQEQCIHWWDGICHTMGCIFNEWDDHEEEGED